MRATVLLSDGDGVCVGGVLCGVHTRFVVRDVSVNKHGV